MAQNAQTNQTQKKVKNVVLVNNNFFDLQAIKLLGLKKFFKSDIPGLVNEIVYSSPDHDDKIIFNYYTGIKWDPTITIETQDTIIVLYPELLDPYMDPILNKPFVKITDGEVDSQEIVSLFQGNERTVQVKVPFGNQNIILKFKKAPFTQDLA